MNLIKQLLKLTLVTTILNGCSTNTINRKNDPVYEPDKFINAAPTCDEVLQSCIKVVEKQRTAIQEQQQTIEKQDEVIEQQDKVIETQKQEKSVYSTISIMEGIALLLIILL